MELINAISVAASNDPPPGPVIVVGDINSSPEDPDDIPDFQPPYMQFESAGYVDAWTLRPGKPKGFTCCFDEDLSIPADLYERIDVIFSYETPSRVKANVLGNDEADQTASGLWPSDHAGVAARIKF
jgi:exonuclease III